MDRQEQESKWTIVVVAVGVRCGCVEKEKKEEPKGLGKRDVGPQGRKSHKMEAPPTTEVESQKGKLA